MKGRKGSTDEGGVRSPLFVRWPGHINSDTRFLRSPVSSTFCQPSADLAGVEVASKKPLDGKSLKPLLLGNSERLARPHDLLSLAEPSERADPNNFGSITRAIYLT